MIPNLPDYKIIKVKSKILLQFSLKTTYTPTKTSIFNYFSTTSNLQKYPVVCKIDEDSESYKQGLRVGHKIIKLNDISLEYKDIPTILSDFTYEKKNSDFIKLTII
tara:strand:- start:1592 stop:1909 length:318 start_codon:yes stop_codon:yes gene_type:complete